MSRFIRLLLILLPAIIFPALPPACAETSTADTKTAATSTLKQARLDLKTTRDSIRADRKKLIQRLEKLKQEVDAEKAALKQDTLRLKALRLKRDKLQKEMGEGPGDHDQITNIARQYAKNLLALKEKSPYAAEPPHDVLALKDMVTAKHPVGLGNIKRVVDISFRDMAVSHEIRRYRGPVFNRRGQTVEAEIVRLGHLGALYRLDDTAGYLIPSPATGQLATATAPGFRISRNLKAYFEKRVTSPYMDIAGGAAVTRLSRRIPFGEQIQSGGMLVWPILLVGFVALIITLERLWFLGRVRHNTDALITGVVQSIRAGDFKGALAATEPHRMRPTARVLAAGLENRDNPKEVIESALSGAIVRETPRLERFLTALKVLAAVAPLLGLLGTVTGMINTFQVITTHGTGEPRLMAGGISEAMVTTQMGLAVAIPIMMVAAFLGRRASRLIQDMEEKALALMGALLKADQHRIQNGAG